MKLSRTTPCSLIKIKSPRWKQRVIGIASFRIRQHNAIQIEARDKDGFKYYPETYYMSGSKIMTYKTQELPSGVKLYLVPIKDLEVLEHE